MEEFRHRFLEMTLLTETLIRRGKRNSSFLERTSSKRKKLIISAAGSGKRDAEANKKNAKN